jgi:type IV pilus assembly protein PilO
MTVGGEYIPARERGFDEGPKYPTVFGIPLTPTVSGVAIALVGLAGAVYLVINLVQPAWQENQALKQSVEEKRSQLVNREETQRQIQEARTRLRAAQQLQADVLSLFASEESMDTLLLDLNERVQSVNAGITDPSRRAVLSRFQAVIGESSQSAATPDALISARPDVVSDSSLGPELNGKLERRVYNVELEGNFNQTQSIIRSIERLQPLLIVRNLRSELDEATQLIRVDEQGRVVPNGQPQTRITTSFQLIALLPVEPPAPAATPATAPTGIAPASPATPSLGVSPAPSPGASPAPAASP